MAASSSAAPPNVLISNMLSRSREVEIDTTSCIERASVTGRPVA
jgi:hypothetical protein